MRILDLLETETYFNIAKLNRKTLEVLKEKKKKDLFNSKLRENIELLESLLNGTASNKERIKRALRVVIWKSTLIKYDLLDNENDILIQFEEKVVFDW